MSDDSYNFFKELDGLDRGQPTQMKQSEEKQSLPRKVYTENADSHPSKKENDGDKDDK